ncbi:MAG: hypothetical protein COW01_05600 [Bdellovibrionales bacterium CG12_big_fil_rev_8_21_14_0_65_38_15]|nr:MAG: hypothetical protein COW79_03495 [Bdellovibrionales bacterium CG22_combo_CG10-13_8_21_14_all_38_13]PIQ55906.1 MAG: hypothetical protein COW01_05600 [Bdellovibrionales bacterium CG12_big_fil_rev_8_21_14_0_65_38_15]PIR29643.1 MAG: hypothetical protein COV38_09420 [Bdellovibrionales bacterium CG11_big_fil_rev_8_21_14_0_20_38_13]
MQPHLEINSTCIECDNCLAICPDDAILKSEQNGYTIDTFACTLCGLCIEVCPVDSIKLSTQTNS